MELEQPMTIGAAAAKLGIPSYKLREWVNRRSGNCPYIPWGKQKRVFLSEVEDWMKREQVKH